MEQTHEKPADDHVLETPLWVTIVRGFQFLVSLIILALAGRIMHDAYLDENGFALAMGIITWLAVAYIVFAEKIASFRQAYHIIAVLVLDGLLVILWLACWAANAAERSKYRYRTTVSGCFDDGSLLDSKTCFRKRDVLFFKTGLSMFSAICGLGALVWLLFIATFAWTLWSFLRLRREGRFQFNTDASPNSNYQMESKIAEAQPMAGQQQVPQGHYQPPPPPAHGPYPPPQGEVPPVPYQQPQSPYQPQGPYQAPPQTYPGDGQYVHQQHSQHQQQYQAPVSAHYGQHTSYGGDHGHSASVTTSSPPPPQEMQSQPDYSYNNNNNQN